MQQSGGHLSDRPDHEAYQIRSDALLGISSLFEVIFSVGDPGQLDPFSVIDDSLWRSLPYSPTRTAMVTPLAGRRDAPALHLEAGRM